MRSSHGSSRDHFSPPIVPSGNDVQAGSEDIDWGTIIREEGPLIIDIRSSDSDRLLNAGGRVVARVIVVVSGGYGYGDAALVKLRVETFVSGVAVKFYQLGAYRYNSLVEGIRRAATQAHRGNRRSSGRPCCFDDPEHAGDTVIRWRVSPIIDKKQGRKAYTSEREPEP